MLRTKGMLYAGFGSREPDERGLRSIARVATTFAAAGMVVRSAHAKGCDRAFETAHAPEAREIITNKTPIVPQAYAIAEAHHGAWHLCDQRTRDIHARNVMIFLGPTLGAPIHMAVLWSPASIEDFGGSALGMRICRTYGAPCFNIRNADEMADLERYIAERFDLTLIA
jgi:hypothetical protein